MSQNAAKRAEIIATLQARLDALKAECESLAARRALLPKEESDALASELNLRLYALSQDWNGVLKNPKSPPSW
jgi:chemotaxis regulatin CheY-phosphate phosphatase CheZ